MSINSRIRSSSFYLQFVVLNVIFMAHQLSCEGIGDRSITDLDLKEISEKLYKEDVNNAGNLIVISYQGHTTSSSKTDAASHPLLTFDRRIYEIPTIVRLLKLYDNYEADTKHDEIVTPSEKQEEAEFLSAVLNTTVMLTTKSWLQTKGLVPKDYQGFYNFLQDLWFTVYSRGHRKMSSSAFEHIFLGEKKNNQVSGLHNWIFFAHEEKRNQLNYLGWIRKIDFPGKKGSLVKLHYTWGNTDKPVGTLLIGTSPELELSLYTICFLVRPNEKCPVSLGGKNLLIQTYTFANRNNEKLIGSAYPGFL